MQRNVAKEPVRRLDITAHRHFVRRFQGANPPQRADPRTELAKAQAPIGLLQLPRSRGERLRHMEIIDRVPFDLVPAYHEREAARGRLVGAAKGPIGKILRRHRTDSSTTLIHTILKACVEKRWDAMLWDTFAGTVRHELSYMGPADIGLVLLCCIKADFGRNSTLVPDLLKRLATLVMAGGKSILPSGVGHASGTLATAAAAAAAVPQASRAHSGRRHRSRRTRHAGSEIRVAKATFPEHALLAGMAAANHFGLREKCGDDLARVAARASQGCGDISSNVLCRMVHHAGSLVSKSHGASGLSKFLQRALPELQMRLNAGIAGQAVSPGDICLIAHAYAHAKRPDTNLFKDLRQHLLKEDGVALLKLSVGELTNLLNAFAKSSDAAKNGNLELFDRLGRQLLQAFPQKGSYESYVEDFQDMLDLRNASVSLNAFAQASLRHEPFFLACDNHLPAFLNSSQCDLRQLAMIAHAYVRVGLSQSCLLPLVWDFATRLAPHSDAQGVALMIFAVTKAAVNEASGFRLLQALSSRLLELLQGPESLYKVPQQTIAVSAYALAKSGYKDCVEEAVWSVLAQHGRCHLRRFSMTEAANLASAFAEVLGNKAAQNPATTLELHTFFDELLGEVTRWISSEDSKRPLPPAAAAKMIVAFGDTKCYEAAGAVQELARRFLLPSPQVPVRSVIQALSKLHVFDEDLVQALTMAQKASVRRRHP